MEHDMTTYPTFPASKVEDLRNRLDLTQEQFAQKLGVSRTLVTHWEKGIRVPSGPVAILLDTLNSQKNLSKRRNAS